MRDATVPFTEKKKSDDSKSTKICYNKWKNMLQVTYDSENDSLSLETQ